MKKYLLLIILGFGYSQATSFSIYGVGEKIQNIDPSAISLGNSSFFSGNSKSISNESPSSLWRSALTRFSIYSGINYLNKNYKIWFGEDLYLSHQMWMMLKTL